MASPPTRQLHFAASQYISFLIIWIGLFCFVEINAVGDLVEVLGNGGGQTQREFDYFKLSLLWPGTSCRTTSRCCSSNGCCRGSDAPAEFTIHGLWGDYNDGTWPACCTGKPFDIKKISALLGTMNKYWPTLNCDSISNCYGGKGLFWEHEWEKHGTCTARVTGDEYNYFLTTLNLYFKHNVTEVMRKDGYVASNSEKYPLGGIISAIQNAFHATPELVCSGDAVAELRLCFSKNLKLQDCEVESNRGSGVIKSETSCPRYVSLPDYVPLNHTNKGPEVLQSTFVQPSVT